jgi:hypothetical protein
LSTLLLAALGLAYASVLAWAAALLVAGGAVLAGRETWDKRLRMPSAPETGRV